MEIDAPEVPIMDGSSQAFVDAIEAVGTQVQSQAPPRDSRIKRSFLRRRWCKKVTLSPSATPIYAGTIEFDTDAIGTQSYEMKLVNGNFKHDMADCRTFCMLK